MDIFDQINKQKVDNTPLPRTLIEQDKRRSWKPFTKSVYYDRTNATFVIIDNGFAWSEKRQEAVVLSTYNRSITFVIMLKAFNEVKEDGYLRFIEINNPQAFVFTRDVLSEALTLLREAEEELSGEDLRLQDKIKQFIKSLEQ